MRSSAVRCELLSKPRRKVTTHLLFDMSARRRPVSRNERPFWELGGKGESIVMPTTSDEAKHWRTIAREATTTAQKTTDAGTKAMILDIAAGYDRLAEMA